MRSSAVYQHWLDLVSRSFALCIPQLDPPFRDHVALAYLLLRVLDTIEDAPFDDQATQQRQFQRLRAFLRVMPSQTEAEAFVAAFPAGIVDGERALLGDTFALLEDAHSLPRPVRDTMIRAIDRMARGMAAYTRRPWPLRLIDLEDVARYCCFVAGIVGEMLTELWALEHSEPPPQTALAYHFGVFLQKVNILKDQREDEAAGRFLVPNRVQLIASLRADADGALAYLQALPRADRGYRTFCAWSLMLGATTVAQLDGPRQSRRDETARLLAHTASVAQDNEALAQLFVDLMPALPELARPVTLEKPESIEWVRATLAAPLTETELLRLGIASAAASALAR